MNDLMNGSLPVSKGQIGHAVMIKTFRPVLTWMFSNVVSKVDANDNVYPRKQKPENKIDGVIALIMAMGRLMAGEEETIMPGIEVI